MTRGRGKKPPVLGDTITHHEPGFDRTNSGKVVQLLSQQFIYETKEGHHRHCMFWEDWKQIKEDTNE